MFKVKLLGTKQGFKPSYSVSKSNAFNQSAKLPLLDVYSHLQWDFSLNLMVPKFFFS